MAAPLGALRTGAPPTPEARAYAAALLGRLSARGRVELNTGEVPLPNGETVELVDVEQVCDWLDGLRTRLAAGSDL